MQLPNLQVLCLGLVGYPPKIEFEQFAILNNLEVYIENFDIKAIQDLRINSESITNIKLKMKWPVYCKEDLKQIKKLTSTLFSNIYVPNLREMSIWTRIKSIDAKWFKNLRELSKLNILSSIDNIDSVDFQYLGKLQALRLSSCSFTELKENDLSFLVSLTSLYVSGQSIKKFHSNVFSFSKHLETLQLPSTSLFKENGKLKGAWFVNLNNLVELNVSSCSLTTLDSETFIFLPKLKNLDLSSNNITKIDSGVFANLKSLRSLILKYNYLQELSNNVFSELAALESLDISWNRLTYLHLECFRGLARLKELKLDGNSLETFDKKILKEIKEIETISLIHNRTLNKLAVTTSLKEHKIDILV